MTVDEARLVGTKPDYGIGDFLGLPKSADRHKLFGFSILLGVVARELFGDAACDDAGADGIDAQALPRDFKRPSTE